MSYIYRLPNNCSIIPNKQKYNLEYLSVKKGTAYLSHLGSVAIYLKNKEGEGIFGFGKIMSKKTMKSSLIDPDKKIKFLNRNFCQIEIESTGVSRYPLIAIRHLRFFPSFNSKTFNKPFNPYVLYWAGSLHWEWNYIATRFPYDIRYGINPISDRYLKFYIHNLREKSINYFWNKKLPKENSQCAACGLKSDYPYFLEIHDTVKIDFDSDYQPVNSKNFIVLCPNCHKKEHLQMRDNNGNSISI